jgi:WhiB family redox-sensing transcriptional regulator
MLVNVRTSGPAQPRTTTTTTGDFVALTWIRTHDWDADAWRANSACRDSDPDIFFPIGSTGPALEQIETARRICTACNVSEECLEFALATNQEAGVWGGTTEEERRKLRKVWLAEQRRAAS